MMRRSGSSSRATSVAARAITTSSRRLRRAPGQWRGSTREGIMRDFVYHHPTSLDEARQLALEEGAMLLAGGQTLLRDMKRGRHAPTSLIDVTGIVPKKIESLDDAVWIGAGATHAEVAHSPVLQQHLPVLAALVDHIGDPAVRNRG